MFMLATQTLIKLYAHLTSFATIYFAYMMAPLTSYSLSVSSLSLILSNVIIRVFLAATFFVCRVYLTSDHESRRGRPNQAPPENGNSVNDTVQNNTEDHLPITLLDNVLMFLLLISGVVQIPVTIFIPVVICLHVPLIASLPMLYNFLLSSWAETKRIQNEYGLSHLIQVESNRLRINSVFRLFWITRAIYDAFFRCCDEPTSLVLRHVMTHGTETFTGVIGLTVTVSCNTSDFPINFANDIYNVESFLWIRWQPYVIKSVTSCYGFFILELIMKSTQIDLAQFRPFYFLF